MSRRPVYKVGERACLYISVGEDVHSASTVSYVGVASLSASVPLARGARLKGATAGVVFAAADGDHPKSSIVVVVGLSQAASVVFVSFFFIQLGIFFVCWEVAILRQ